MKWYKKIFRIEEIPSKEELIQGWRDMIKPLLKVKIDQATHPHPLGDNSAIFLLSADFNGSAQILMDWQKKDKVSLKNMIVLIRFLSNGEHLKQNILDILRNSEQTKDVRYLIKEIEKEVEEPFVDPEAIL